MKTRMTPQEAGRKGGLIGGKSRSPAKIAAARRNGFQRSPSAPEPELQTSPLILMALETIKKDSDADAAQE